MMRTKRTIFFVALSGALTGPSAFAQGYSAHLDDYTSLAFQLDAGSVIVAGNDRAIDDNLLFDVQAQLEIERLSDDGRRWGFVVSGRIEHDSGRKSWGGRVGDCPAGTGDCSTWYDGVSNRPLRSPVSGLHSAGPGFDDGTRAAFESGYVFMGSGWGEFRLGYGAGAANLNSVSVPSAFRLSRADGGRVDPTGIMGARTRNLTSGYSPKVVFHSIRMGQASTIGSIRFSTSFTPEVRDCGVDFCVQEYGAEGLLSPVANDVWEFGARYEVQRGEHEFDFSIGVSSSTDATDRLGFEGVKTYDLGLVWSKGDWSAGARLLRSNNGISFDNSYEAWSTSIAREVGLWMVSLEYANFSDNLIHVDGETFQASASRLVGDNWVLGVGIQQSKRDEPMITNAGRSQIRADSTSIFVEMGWQF